MVDFYVEKGQTSSFTKTVSESDVFMFAGITGDFSPNHVNKAYMEKSSYGKLMAHGALMVGFMSTVSTMAIAHTRDAEETPVSVGYDKIQTWKLSKRLPALCISSFNLASHGEKCSKVFGREVVHDHFLFTERSTR